MEIIRNGSRPSRKGPEEYFTGEARIDPLWASSRLRREGDRVKRR